ncbi:type VII secretion integral membrane protein EccD [Streptomyces sp. NPDC057245]|uniref:type VII secretion integral membrane protein EccD n=1 Tax=Streptomyces TaxID=1883 RepID=UPI001C1E6C75|nr:type VII secretion integral membrane protein EccD [Streptomyces sp. A108]MBU6534594.1 type VII secretion integral membrane protein EccD [Streptomyces sp. A108]
MSDTQTAGLCRMTVRAPSKSIDLAVPSDVPVADLLPAVAGYGGEDLEESGIDHGGWVLQRLGAEPMDEERTLDSYDLRDGETLYLRPRIEALPELRLDDLVDGISTTMNDRPYGWTPEASRRLLRGVALAALAGGLLVLSLPGGSAWLRVVCAAVVGLLLVAGAASASRAVGDAGAGAVLGAMVAPYFAYAGWLLPGGELTGEHAHEVIGARLLAACAAGAGGAVLVIAVASAYAALFLGTAVVAAFGVLAAVLMLTVDLAPHHVAGVVALAAVILGAFVPSLSFRMSGLRMPPLPTNAQQLQEGIEPHSPSAVAARTAIGDGWMSALYGAVGTVCGACLLVLTRSPNLSGTILALTLSLLLVLHARGLGNAWQRLFLIVPGTLGPFLLLLGAADSYEPDRRPLILVALLAVTAAAAIASWTVPGRRLVPYWGRAAEILHTLSAVALLPLALWLVGVYGTLRGLLA